MVKRKLPHLDLVWEETTSFFKVLTSMLVLGVCDPLRSLICFGKYASSVRDQVLPCGGRIKCQMHSDSASFTLYM